MQQVTFNETPQGLFFCILENFRNGAEYPRCPYCGSRHVVLRNDTRCQCLECGQKWN